MAAARDRHQLLGHNSAACCCATLMAALLLQQHWSASTLLARCGGRICRSPPTSTTCLRSPSVTRQAISIMVFFSMSRPAIFRGAVSTLNAAATACARRQCTWQPGRCRGAEALHNTAQHSAHLWRGGPTHAPVISKSIQTKGSCSFRRVVFGSCCAEDASFPEAAAAAAAGVSPATTVSAATRLLPESMPGCTASLQRTER